MTTPDRGGTPKPDATPALPPSAVVYRIGNRVPDPGRAIGELPTEPGVLTEGTADSTLPALTRIYTAEPNGFNHYHGTGIRPIPQTEL